MSLDPKDPWRQVAARSETVSKKREIPSFACEETHELSVSGRKLVFHAVSGPCLLRVQKSLGAPFGKVLAAALAGREALQAALAELLERAGEQPQAVGALVLDALRDEDWNDAPSSSAAIDQFLSQTSGPALVAMLAAVGAVNAKAFLPFVQGLLVDLVGAARAAAGSLSQTPDETQSGSPATSS